MPESALCPSLGVCHLSVPVQAGACESCVCPGCSSSMVVVVRVYDAGECFWGEGDACDALDSGAAPEQGVVADAVGCGEGACQYNMGALSGAVPLGGGCVCVLAYGKKNLVCDGLCDNLWADGVVCGHFVGPAVPLRVAGGPKGGALAA